jgi:uncharacterized RDD family membrane protein YckC
MDKYRINTTQNVDFFVDFASIGDRALAFIIDSIILFVINLGLNILINQLLEETVIPFIISSILSFFYFFISERLLNGQSVGKKVAKIQVRDKNGNGVTVLQSFLRMLLLPIDLYGFGILSILFSKKSQRLGDLASGAIVVRLKEKVTLEETIVVQTDESYEPVFEKIELLKIDSKDIELIKELTAKKELHNQNFELIGLLSEKLQKKTGIQTDMKAKAFLETISKDYNYYGAQEFYR